MIYVVICEQHYADPAYVSFHGAWLDPQKTCEHIRNAAVPDDLVVYITGKDGLHESEMSGPDFLKAHQHGK